MAQEGQVAEGQATVAEAPPETEAQSGTEAAPRTYSDKEVSDIVSKRVNELQARWKDFGDPDSLKQKLSRAEQLERFVEQVQARQHELGNLPGGKQAANEQQPLTEEDKKVQAYMERLYPNFAKQLQSIRDLGTQMQSINAFRASMTTEAGRKFLGDIARKSGYGEEQLKNIEEDVANSIRANPQDLARYQHGDMDVVRRHFEAVDKRIRGYFPQPPAPAPATVDKVRTAQAAGKLPPRMPPAGVPAPTSKQQKLTDEERISRSHEALQKVLNGG